MRLRSNDSFLSRIAPQTPGWQQTSRDQPATVKYDGLQPAQPGLRPEQLQLPPGACQLPHAARHRATLLPTDQVTSPQAQPPANSGSLGQKGFSQRILNEKGGLVSWEEEGMVLVAVLLVVERMKL